MNKGAVSTQIIQRSKCLCTIIEADDIARNFMIWLKMSEILKSLIGNQNMLVLFNRPGVAGAVL